MNPAAGKLQVPMIGLGTYRLYDGECAEVVRTALQLGYRHLDTAAMYGNEAQVGTGIAKSGVGREEIFLTTKVWPHNFRTRDFIDSAERSLSALRTDYVDLLLLHWPNDEVPLEEPLRALETLIAQGKVKNGGVSNFSVRQMAEAREIAGPAVSCNQVQCHIGAVPNDVLKYASEHEITVTAYSPLARGRITKDAALNTIGRKYGMTSSQVALRWMSQQGVAVIPKTRTRSRLEENLASSSFTLSDEDLDMLGRI
ncbi:aldo/keto reductase [Paraburkholderia tropica]|uniref:aldo/keto reductase n=1 Tax=Paraburkholderia tropica TaxID=92647 RepID=UPI0007ED0758|nr:aldo/keto reductase [Paraburkholderia tropica]OBR53123.1 hypothetical protein A6456_09170 [Paraburkholderia tropica]